MRAFDISTLRIEKAIGMNWSKIYLKIILPYRERQLCSISIFILSEFEQLPKKIDNMPLPKDSYKHMKHGENIWRES